MNQSSASISGYLRSNRATALLLAFFLFISVLGAYQGTWKVLMISWIAFLGMSLMLPLGFAHRKQESAAGLITGYGLSSGAMITSACIFLVPTAMNHHPVYGGVGIAFGVLAGYAIHTLTHNLTHHTTFTEPIVLELSTHAFTAGIIIGTVYAAMPELGLLLGIAIISHKSPAGYAAARRLARENKSVLPMLVPSCAIGVTALPVSMLPLPAHDFSNALIFGFATGVFIHVAIDFLPECEIGSDILKHTEPDSLSHHKLDHYRRRAVLTTFIGGLLVFAAWLIISPA